MVSTAADVSVIADLAAMTIVQGNDGDEVGGEGEVMAMTTIVMILMAMATRMATVLVMHNNGHDHGPNNGRNHGRTGLCKTKRTEH